MICQNRDWQFYVAFRLHAGCLLVLLRNSQKKILKKDLFELFFKRLTSSMQTPLFGACDEVRHYGSGVVVQSRFVDVKANIRSLEQDIFKDFPPNT